MSDDADTPAPKRHGARRHDHDAPADSTRTVPAHQHDHDHDHNAHHHGSDDEPHLSNDEQAHFDRIASAFRGYTHMNRPRFDKALRDYRHFQSSIHGVWRGCRIPAARHREGGAAADR